MFQRCALQFTTDLKTYFDETLFNKIHFSFSDKSCNFLQEACDKECHEYTKNRKDKQMKQHQTIASKIGI